MNRYFGIALAVAAGMLTGCSSPERRAEAPASSSSEPSPADAARITQFYTTKALVSRGDTALVCYGVENATAVWLEPPRQELSAALARCVEVSPVADTTYKLTGEGADGKTGTGERKVPGGGGVGLGGARALMVKESGGARGGRGGDVVSFSYGGENGGAVTIDPIAF